MLTGGNGNGLWCHAKPSQASVSMYDTPSKRNSDLPPLKQAPKPRPKPKPGKKSAIAEIDEQVESSLVEMLQDQL